MITNIDTLRSQIFKCYIIETEFIPLLGGVSPERSEKACIKLNFMSTFTSKSQISLLSCWLALFTMTILFIPISSALNGALNPSFLPSKQPLKPKTVGLLPLISLQNLYQIIKTSQ